MRALRLTPRRAALASAACVLLWQALVLATGLLQWYGPNQAAADWGLGGLFLLGLAWVVWGVERASRHYEARPRQVSRRNWNPLDLAAWYYGPRSRRLKQSLAALCAYAVAFVLIWWLIGLLNFGKRIYELPAGGGQEVLRSQVVKIQKVIRKKFVINPYSHILFNPPPIEKVDPQILEVTRNVYQVGQGQGTGAGFSGGTARGKVRFIRLQYAGGDWNLNHGPGGDLNMLLEYGIRTGQRVAEQTESLTVSQLASFPPAKSPPLVYLTGQRRVELSRSEKKVLRDYLLDKHGMVFADNGGSMEFHNHVIAILREVTGVEEVPIPLDDPINGGLTFFPYVSPHGGRVPLGWKVEGRWVGYYHPGDIGDAWADGHAGVRPEVWQACYHLGASIILYAHAEYNKWLHSQKPE